jgi:glycogen operon protein
MVKELHQNGLEVYMYFYFTPEFCRTDILDVLRYWVMEYRLDGFHLLGVDIPLAMITQDRILSGTKIIYNEYSYWEDFPRYRNTGVFRDHFLTEIRKMLKGDEDMASALLYHQRNLPADRGSINYLANYGGFSLFDMMSYDKKRNEANGEDNRDGTNHNFSWNCGVEGPSRKKNIIALRTKKIKNALTLLILSQGTPFIFSGDEFGNTRFGNNNAYCQDNDTGWVKWPTSAVGQEILAFTKEMIKFRKAHPILHMSSELRILDWQRCGYPDVSYHGEAAWRPDLTPYSRTVGIMLCGKYARRKDKSADDFIFIAVNMHWQEQPLALPHLPKDLSWRLAYSTDENEPDLISAEDTDSILIKERSVYILISEKNL